MAVPKSQSDLKSFFNREEFVRDTVKQIQKDLSGLDSSFEVKLEKFESPLHEISDELRSTLQKLKSPSIQQFVYRVDLKQSEFERALRESDDYEMLAFMIIQREAQKVYLRALYG